MGGRTSKAALGVEVVPVTNGSLLLQAPVDTYTIGATLFVSHVTTLRLLMDYTPGGVGGSFEFIAQVSHTGNVADWFDTTITNLGVLTVLAAGTSALTDTYVHRFAVHAGKKPVDYVIILNQSTPYIRFNFAEYLVVAPAPGSIIVTAMLS